MASHESRNTSSEHLDAFYATFEQVRDERFDGLVITGAPIELLPFEQVNYWDELCQIMDWSLDNVFSTLYICWGAQAGLYRHHGIEKIVLPDKMFGVFDHRILRPHARVLSGFDEVFPAPHSRHTGTRAQDIHAAEGIEVLAESDEAGVYLAASEDGRQIDRVLGQKTRAAPTDPLALGNRVARPVGHRDHHLTTRRDQQAPRHDQTWKSRTHRPIPHATPTEDPPHIREENPRRSPTKQRRWIRAEGVSRCPGR